MKYPQWPVFSSDEIDVVSAVLASGKVNYWTGELGKQFEADFARFVGCNYGVAVANGTLALECALKAIELEPGDEVIVPCKTFIATASAVVACQGVPVIADIDYQSQNISVDSIQQLISKKTKAIIVVHLNGLPCDMAPIVALARKSQLYLIEDCAQAHGASYYGQAVGSIGDIGVFSFCQDKIMTTGGEGGMLVTNNRSMWQRAWSYKDHGKDYATVHTPAEPGFRWVHHHFGSNFRMTEMQAAIGLKQLEKLPRWLQQRQANASYFIEVFKDLPAFMIYQPPASSCHAYYKLQILLDPNYLRPLWHRDRIYKALYQRGIPCAMGCCAEIYREKAFAGYSAISQLSYEQARKSSENSLVLSVHPTLKPEHLQHMAENILAVMKQAIKNKLSTSTNFIDIH